jgi:hypothetical protein
VRVAADGAFAATVGGLRAGPNRFALRATSPGRTAWRGEIVVVRR